MDRLLRAEIIATVRETMREMLGENPYELRNIIDNPVALRQQFERFFAEETAQ